MRSSRSQAKESLQAASSAMLASPPLGRRSGPTFNRSPDFAFPQNARGYDMRRHSATEKRTGAPSEVTAFAQTVLDGHDQDKDGSASPTWSPMSDLSTAASFNCELSDFSASSGSFSRSQPLPPRATTTTTGGGCGSGTPAALRAESVGPRSRPRSGVPSPCPRDEEEESLADFGEGDGKTHRLLSRLLARRDSGPLMLQTDGLTRTPKAGRRHSAPTTTVAAPKKTIRHLAPDEKIFDLFHWDEVLQEEGDGGKVVVCKPKDYTRHNNKDYVMKIRSKEKLAEQHFEQQFRRSQSRMLNFPTHSGVLALHEVLEDEKFYYVLMEKAEGGNFFSSLLSEFEDGVMPASAVRQLMREILEAVSHVHKQGMLHRDIKPDNLVMQLCEGTDPRRGKVRKVALIDFDHADPDWDPMTPSCRQNEFCGTVQYSAPEAFLGYFSQSSDLYSIGVILYLLMTGKMPYENDIYEEETRRRHSLPNKHCVWSPTIVQRMKDFSIDWECNPWPEQKLCRNFCRSLLAFDPLMRPVSAEEALRHDWFSQQGA